VAEAVVVAALAVLAVLEVEVSGLRQEQLPGEQLTQVVEVAEEDRRQAVAVLALS